MKACADRISVGSRQAEFEPQPSPFGKAGARKQRFPPRRVRANDANPVSDYSPLPLDRGWNFYISGVWEFQPNLQYCHPERSEGSLYLTSSSAANELETLGGVYAEQSNRNSSRSLP